MLEGQHMRPASPRMRTTVTASIMITITAVMIITTDIPMLMIMGTKDGLGQSEPTKVAAEPNDPGSVDDKAALYRLMTWLSPSFPVGAFSYSSGIEWAVEAGDITSAPTLQNWIISILSDGSGLSDAIFLAAAHRATSPVDETALRDIAELAAAFAPSRERHLETAAQGRAFIEIARAAWTEDNLERAVSACRSVIVYPVAVGLVSAVHGVPLAATLHAFLHALVSNWISAGARLIPLGQTDSQRILAALEPAVANAARCALHASLDDLGSATFRADLASMRHETQYTRLFRS